MIQSGFNNVLLKTVAYFQEGPGLRNWQYASSGIPFLNIRTLRDDGTIDTSLCQFVKNSEFDGKYEHFLLDKGDYVVSSSGTLGKLAEVRSQDLPLMLNTSVIRFRPIDSQILNRVYLKWFIKSPLYIRQIERASTGIAIKNYGPSHLKKMFIPLPPLSEQRRIVELLDQADALRKKRAEADAKAERILPALFVKMFGDPVTNPKGLEEVELGELIAEGPQNGLYKHASFYGEGTPILRIDSFYAGVVDTSKELRRLQLTDDEIEKYSLEENDIVINRVNGSKELFGKSALVPKLTEKTVFESNMMRFSVNQKKLNPVFIIQQLQTPAIRQQMIGSSKHINQYSVNQGDIKSLRILLPSIKLQDLFAERITSLQSLTGQQASSQTKLETLFQTLLHCAFSGDLTAEWRKAHMAELLQEMEHQARVLGLEGEVE
jgi:type I restriction enzyme S subunit